MSVQDAVLAGRRAAEALMFDEVSVVRPGVGGPVFDPVTGEYTEPASTDVYEGACRVQVTDSLNAQTSEAGGHVATVQRVMLQLPISVTAVQVGDMATITVATNDPALLGRVYRVVATHAKTHATARRLQCEEVTA